MNKGFDIVRSTYYQSKFPDTSGADIAISREEYFKGHVNNYLSIDERGSPQSLTPNVLGSLKLSRDVQKSYPNTSVLEVAVKRKDHLM